MILKQTTVLKITTRLLRREMTKIPIQTIGTNTTMRVTLRRPDSNKISRKSLSKTCLSLPWMQ